MQKETGEVQKYVKPSQYLCCLGQFQTLDGIDVLGHQQKILPQHSSILQNVLRNANSHQLAQ